MGSLWKGSRFIELLRYMFVTSTSSGIEFLFGNFFLDNDVIFSGIELPFILRHFVSTIRPFVLGYLTFFSEAAFDFLCLSFLGLERSSSLETSSTTVFYFESADANRFCHSVHICTFSLVLCFSLFFFLSFFFFLRSSCSVSLGSSLVELASLWHFRQKSTAGVSPSLIGCSWWYFLDRSLPQFAQICLVIVMVVLDVTTFSSSFDSTGFEAFRASSDVLLKWVSILTSSSKSALVGLGCSRSSGLGAGMRYDWVGPI